MKKFFLPLFFILFSFHSYSQIRFEKGYVIDNNGEKIECFIKDMGWKYNPKEIEYKISPEASLKKAGLNDIKEFEIYNSSKYIRADVDIDRSSSLVSFMDDNRKPNFKKERLFLEVLVEGDVSLYEYRDTELKRYFVKKQNQPITQLVFKHYLTPDNKVYKNETYKQQLINMLKCPEITKNRIMNTNYSKKDLVRLIVKYNQCVSSDYKDYTEKPKEDLFNLNLRLGINNSSLSIRNSALHSLDTDFPNKIGLRISAEAEFIMPFNKNKWALLIESTYQSYNAETQSLNANNNGEKLTATVNYSSIEFPIGIRYYLFLKNDTKLFVNLLNNVDILLSKKIEFQKEDGSYLDPVTIYTFDNLGIGVGYQRNKYSVELRYQTPKEILKGYLAWQSHYNTFSLIVGYNIL